MKDSFTTNLSALQNAGFFRSHPLLNPGWPKCAEVWFTRKLRTMISHSYPNGDGSQSQDPDPSDQDSQYALTLGYYEHITLRIWIQPSPDRCAQDGPGPLLATLPETNKLLQPSSGKQTGQTTIFPQALHSGSKSVSPLTYRDSTSNPSSKLTIPITVTLPLTSCLGGILIQP